MVGGFRRKVLVRIAGYFPGLTFRMRTKECERESQVV